MNLHLCLSTQGNTPDCQNCSVSHAGHLNDFIALLKVRTGYLKMNYVLADYEREDIISDSVIRVHKQVDQFHGVGNYRQQPAKFKSWANTIFHGVYVDHCRKKLGRKNASSNDDDEPVEPRLKFVSIEKLYSITADDTDSKSEDLLADAITELMKDEKYKECCDILNDYCDWGKEGIGQAEMAERYGISYDNFRVKLSRARSILKKKIRWNN
jgi:RNA polymerase sigma factor (sigma-70 family)